MELACPHAKSGGRSPKYTFFSAFLCLCPIVRRATKGDLPDITPIGSTTCVGMQTIPNLQISAFPYFLPIRGIVCISGSKSAFPPQRTGSTSAGRLSLRLQNSCIVVENRVYIRQFNSRFILNIALPTKSVSTRCKRLRVFGLSAGTRCYD